MALTKTNGIIYRMHRYSDNSAVITMLANGYGKLKLFAPKIVSRGKGFHLFIPGSVEFTKRSSDLHKISYFEADPTYYWFIDDSKVNIRLMLMLEYFDICYGSEQSCDSLITLIKRYTDSNFINVTIFGLHMILKNSGYGFSIEHCASCGKEFLVGLDKLGDNLNDIEEYYRKFADIVVSYFVGGDFFCTDCYESEIAPKIAINKKDDTNSELESRLNVIKVNGRIYEILLTLYNPQLFSKMHISYEEENIIYGLYFQYAESTLGRTSKALFVFRSFA